MTAAIMLGLGLLALAAHLLLRAMRDAEQERERLDRAWFKALKEDREREP